MKCSVFSNAESRQDFFFNLQFVKIRRMVAKKLQNDRRNDSGRIRMLDLERLSNECTRHGADAWVR